MVIPVAARIPCHTESVANLTITVDDDTRRPAVLASEDLNTGQAIGPLTIVNPFSGPLD